LAAHGSGDWTLLASEFADVILIPTLGAVALVELDISGHQNQISGGTGYVISY
jgi:hypothetical protein